jgi:hypothetical protein
MKPKTEVPNVAKTVVKITNANNFRKPGSIFFSCHPIDDYRKE